MSTRFPPAVRECDVPAVLARILAVPETAVRALFDHYGRPRSVGVGGRRYVSETGMREWVAKMAGRQS